MPKAQKRSIFFISDSTGITVEMLGHSLLAQFKNQNFHQVTLPFVNSTEKAHKAAQTITEAAQIDTSRPIVFSTLIHKDIVDIISATNCLFFDYLRQFIAPLEAELGLRASRAVGSLHSDYDPAQYFGRMNAINFSLTHDDGLGLSDLNTADVVLCGVSRCGKTPTCLYLAMQFGIKAANYPFIPEDLTGKELPKILHPCRSKLFGLTIDPIRLQQVRRERRADSQYCALENCEFEIKAAERIMRGAGLQILDTTAKSIEELATTILQLGKFERNIY